jgi:hypothetical protein
MLAHGKRSAAVGKGAPHQPQKPRRGDRSGRRGGTVRGGRTFPFGLCVRLKLAPFGSLVPLSADSAFFRCRWLFAPLIARGGDERTGEETTRTVCGQWHQRQVQAGVAGARRGGALCRRGGRARPWSGLDQPATDPGASGGGCLISQQTL